MLASITTARASYDQLETWNSVDAATLAPEDSQEMRARAVVRDATTGLWRGISRAEACLAMGLPAEYADSIKSEHKAAVCIGSAFSSALAAHALSSHFPALQDNFESINYVDLFAGIGVGAYVAVIASECGLINLNAIVSVELDPERSDVFAAWLASRPAGRRVRHVRIRDITLVSDAEWQELLLELGGAHLVCGGSPCNNMSGACP